MSQTKAQLIDPVDGTIVNADINASAAIAGSKISPSFTSALITNAATSGAADANQAVFDYNSSDTRILSYNSSGSTINFFTNPNGGSLASRLLINSSGNVGIGTTSPAQKLHIQSTGDTILRVTSADGNAAFLDLGDVSDPDGGRIHYDSGSNLVFNTSSSERARIDSSGRLLLGTTTARAVGGESNPRLHIEGSGNTSNSWVNLTRFQAGTGSANFQFAKARSNTPGTYTVVQNGDNLGQISFLGADGTDMANYAAIIKSQVDGTPGSNDMPGRLVFMTTADGGTFPTERMRINQAGRVGINTTGPESELSVDGSVSISSNAVAVSPSGYDLKIRSNTSKLGIHTDNASGTPILEFGTGGATGGRIYTSQATPLRLGTNSGEDMRVHSDNNILIGTTTSNNSGRLQVTTPNQVVASFESTNNDPQIYLGDDMSSPTNNVLILGYDRADNRGYLTIGGDADTTLSISDGSLVGINTSANVEHFNVAGNIRLINPTGTTRRINALQSGTYNTGTSGGSAICFQRFSDAGGGSDEIFFETHHQGSFHGESLRIEKTGDLKMARGDIYFATAGKGIVLGATSNTDANTLHDYEEGTFSGTATAAGYTGGIALADEHYTKIGRTVHFNCRLSVASSLSDGDLTLTGLPFSTAQDSVVDFSWQDAAGFSGGQGKISGTSCVRFGGVFPTHHTGTANIIFSGTYRTAA